MSTEKRINGTTESQSVQESQSWESSKMFKVHRFLKIGLVETYGLERIPCYIQHQNKYQDIQAAPVSLGGQIVIVK